jgi:prepilin peptidase CpaA
MAEQVAFFVALGICVSAAVTDIRFLQIYNWLTLPALVLGLLWQLATAGPSGLLDGMAGVLIAFAVLLIPFMIGGMGAGDVKLMSALGAWLGASSAAQILLIACLLTGAASILSLIRRGGLSAAWLNMKISWFRLQTLKHHLVLDQPHELRSMKEDEARKSELIPFSIMLLLAVLLVLLIQAYPVDAITSLHFLMIR